MSGDFTAADKEYDGNTGATVTGYSLAAAAGDTGKVAGDAVSLDGGTATFEDKNVGTGKTVTLTGASLTVDGGRTCW